MEIQKKIASANVKFPVSGAQQTIIRHTKKQGNTALSKNKNPSIEK